ncbi:MAG: fibronectin type III domain-containing protein [Elusimicrobiota bacterium]|nr:MAG: fibronectin type III domain-containing protein [Elusimicrobiota bacterium]
MVLQQIDGSGGGASQSNGGFIVDLTTEIYQVAGNLGTLDTSLTVALPPTSSSMPFGWYALRMGANDLYSNGKLVQAGPAKPATAPLNLVGSAFSTTQMDWSWSSIGGVDGYNVYNATTGVWISSVPALAIPTYRQANLAPSATVSVIVAGFTLSGDGPATNSATTYTLPAVPTAVTISNVTFEDLLLSWNASGNTSPATVYEVTQSSDNFVTDTSTPVPQIFNLSDNFVTIENLSANTTYYFRIRAFNNVGIPSGYSVSVTTRTRAPVTQPVAAGRTTTSIDWTWSDPGGVTNYRVYNATNNVLLATPALNSFTEVGLGTNTEHSIRVSAVTSAGEGPLSPPASAYTLAATPGTFNPPISGLTTGSFLVNWSNIGPNPFATGHNIVLTAFNNDGSMISQTTAAAGHGVYSIGFGGLTPSSLYGYSIVAMNADDVPLPSDSPPVVVGTTWTLPSAPNPLSVLGTSPTSISVTWATNNNGSSATYQVTYSSNNFLINIATAVSFADRFGGTRPSLPASSPRRPTRCA